MRISDEAVEAAARAIMEQDECDLQLVWLHDPDSVICEIHETDVIVAGLCSTALDHARAALEAAIPHIRDDDRDTIARLTRERDEWEGNFIDLQAELTQVRREAQVDALREAADDLDNSTQADIHNAIGRPAPRFSTSAWLSAVLWMEHRADQIEEGEVTISYE